MTSTPSTGISRNAAEAHAGLEVEFRRRSPAFDAIGWVPMNAGRELD
jgi:hypothetical protein